MQTRKIQRFQGREAGPQIRDGPEWREHTPALLSLQQLAVGGDLNVEGHLHVEQVLVLPQVTGHVVLHTDKVQRFIAENQSGCFFFPLEAERWLEERDFCQVAFLFGSPERGLVYVVKTKYASFVIIIARQQCSNNMFPTRNCAIMPNNSQSSG